MRLLTNSLIINSHLATHALVELQLTTRKLPESWLTDKQHAHCIFLIKVTSGHVLVLL